MEAIKVRLVMGAPKGMGSSVIKNLNLKEILTFVILLFTTQLFGQSKVESEVLKVSKDIFRWEVAGQIDSLANLLEDKLVVVGSTGMKRSKDEYVDNLKNGKPVHNKIDVQENSATVNGTTAIVVGKGVFDVTTNGSQVTFHLSYMEVFINKDKGWKLIALYSSRLPD